MYISKISFKKKLAGTICIFFLYLFMCLLLFPFRLSALMIGLSTEELTYNSDIVIEGDVEDVMSYWSNDGETIFTRATIIIQRVIRGETQLQKVFVEYEGGEIGDVGMKVSDIAPIKKGERVILFLKEGKSKENGFVYNAVGEGQGKYIIGEDGIARKGGYSIYKGKEDIDNNIPVSDLVEKIRRIK